jgi:hypothetical protein
MDLNLEIETKIQLTKNQKMLLRFYETVFKEEFANLYKEILVFIMKYLENDNYKSLIINNSTLFDEMKFLSNHFSCYLGINQSLNCSEIIEMKPTLSYLGNCNTYLFKSSKNFEFKSELQLRNKKILMDFYRTPLFLFEYLRTVFYIHSSDSMPSLSYND